MDHGLLDRRSLVAALGAAAAGCLGGPGDDGDDSGNDGSAEDGGTNGSVDDGGTNGSVDGGTERDGADDPSENETGSDGTDDGTDDGTGDLDCDRIATAYGRYDPGDTPLVYTVELPDGAEVTVGEADDLWKLQFERELDGHTIEFELSQNGPKSELSPRFRGEGEDPVVDEIEFGGTTVPLVRYETQSWPQYLTGVPIPGSDGSYATIVTQVDVIDPNERVVDDLCTDAVNAMQRHILGSIQPNPDHTLGRGPDG